MDELKQILIEHARRYPLMEPKDAVKLVYQNEFGGGHLIRDTESCLGYLHREYESVIQSKSLPLTEAIGNGLVRVRLDALDAHHYTPDQLGADFIRSAALHQGSSESFLSKLDILPELAGEGLLPFSSEALDAYLRSYKSAGCPMVSHSDAYRNAYCPAYRIVLRSCISTRENG